MAEPRAIFSLAGPDITTDQLIVESTPVTIGRKTNNTLVLPVPQVSSNHARIALTNGVVTLEDLNSTNGTHVNETRIEPKQAVALKIGDVIRMGPFTLTLTRIDQVEAAAAAPPMAAPPSPLKEEPVSPPYDEPTPPPDVHRSAPPPSPAEAQTVKPQVTHPQSPAQQVLETPVKVPATTKGNGHGPQVRDLDLEIIRPARAPSPNGHTEVLEPYVPIEGIPALESRYMQYLPGVYNDSDFLKRFLLIMESILAPLGWGVDSFEQYYNPLLTTPDWLQWISAWFDILIHPSVPIERQRAVVQELGELFQRRGTRRGLTRLLELYFGVKPEIIELDNPPSTFTVRLKLGKDDTPLNRALAEQLIRVCKPAHTGFTLEVS